MMAPALSHAEEVNLQWLGGPTLLIEFGEIKLLTDPMLGEGDSAYRMADPNEAFDLAIGPTVKDHARMTPLPAFELAEIDAALISHTHEDHFDQQAREQLPKSLPTITPKADAKLMASLNFTNNQLLDWGQSWQVTEGDYKVTVTALPAHHTLNHDMEPILGHGNGYWLAFEHGEFRKTLYWAGDTFMTDALVQQIAALGSPDIFVPHVGRVGTTGPLGKISMGAEDVMAAIEAINPGRTLPIHHTTYQLYLEPISVLVQAANEKHLPVDVVAAGGWVSYR